MVNIRVDCPMRHDNGNCLVCGGFCTAVNDEICSALHQAYEKGYRAGYSACSCDDLWDVPPLGGFHGLED